MSFIHHNGRGLHQKEARRIHQAVKRKEMRKLKERRKNKSSVLSSLGTLGMVGWSVTVPTILGVMAGQWLDVNWPAPHSWTLTLMMVGLVLGCAAAWHWLKKEKNKIQKDDGDEHE